MGEWINYMENKNWKLFRLKEKSNSDVYYSMDGPWGHFPNWMTRFIWSIMNSWIYRHRKQNYGCQGPVGWGVTVDHVLNFSWGRWQSSEDKWWWLHTTVSVLDDTEMWLRKDKCHHNHYDYVVCIWVQQKKHKILHGVNQETAPKEARFSPPHLLTASFKTQRPVALVLKTLGMEYFSASMQVPHSHLLSHT